MAAVIDRVPPPELNGPSERDARGSVDRMDENPGSASISRNRKRVFILSATVLGSLIVLIFGGRWIVHSLHTVSTDDAYVNSHVTFVAPRVAG